MKREEILEFIRIVFKGDDELLRVAEEFENAENLDVNSELKEAIEENFEYGIGSVILGYGLNKEIFEYIDWKGEMDTEVTNCLTKYEMSEGLDIFSNSLLDEIDEYEYEEDDILEEQVKKRIRQKGSVTKENFQKYYGYFARKGFNSGKILDLLRKYMED